MEAKQQEKEKKKSYKKSLGDVWLFWNCCVREMRGARPTVRGKT